LINNIEQEAKGYQDLADELSKLEKVHQSKIKYMLVGLQAAKKMTDQEYKIFVERTTYQYTFEDIGLNMGIKKQTVQYHYEKAVKILRETYQEVKLLRR